MTSLLVVFLVSLVSVVDAQERSSRKPGLGREGRQNHDPRTVRTPDDDIQDALKKIPWNSLSPTARGRVKGVVQSHSLFRRMPSQAVYCDPEMFQYLLEHPDLVVGFWERMGVTQISLKELRENRYVMKETPGTVAQVEVLYQTSDLCLVYAKGQYRGPFLARGIDGETVLLLQTRRNRDEDGEPYIVCKLDTFIRIENLGADFLAKLFSTSLGKIADSNFEQTVAFIGHVSDAATIDAHALKRIAGDVKGVRSEVCDDFSDVVDRVALRSAGREGRLFPQYVVMEESKTEPFISRFPERSSEAVLEEGSDFTASVWTRLELPEMESAAAMPSYANRADEETPAPYQLPIPSGVSTLEGDPPVPKGRVIFGTPKIVRPE